jgi:hypothetical protein
MKLGAYVEKSKPNALTHLRVVTNPMSTSIGTPVLHDFHAGFKGLLGIVCGDTAIFFGSRGSMLGEKGSKSAHVFIC